MQQVVLGFPATAESVAPARQRMAVFLTDAGAAPELVDDCRIVLTEAVTNAVLHAYNGTPGAIQVEFVIESDGAVSIAVADDGAGWQEDSARRTGGRGMGVIRSLTTRCDVVRRQCGGTEVRMWLGEGPDTRDA
jgi:stage II sporulation protein AB (anti-sigma F factor)